MIRIELEKAEVRTDEHLKGRAVWTSGLGKTPRKIEVLCRWRIEKKKGADRSELVDNAVEFEIGDRSQVTVPFDFNVPLDGPLSYDGKLFRIVWEIVARADLPWARDEVETTAFVVRPGPWSPDEYAGAEEELEAGEQEWEAE